jgi:hypothetical protein
VGLGQGLMAWNMCCWLAESGQLSRLLHACAVCMFMSVLCACSYLRCVHVHVCAVCMIMI